MRGFALILMLSLSLCAQPDFVQAGQIEARSAILLNWDKGQVLYSQNADRKIPPASLTKVMSMYIVYDALKKGEVKRTDKVTISSAAAKTGGSRMGLKAGTKVTLDNLLMGMAVASGNDASVAVAEFLAGSQAAFVKLMNAKAKKLGMKNTVFKNVHGLPAEGQYTSAKDMLTLARNYLFNHHQALSYHATKKMTYGKRTMTNSNTLLKNFKGADGLKTGWIRASGYNLIGTARRGKTRIVAVILGAENPEIRSKEIHRLMEAGFSHAAGKITSVSKSL